MTFPSCSRYGPRCVPGRSGILNLAYNWPKLHKMALWKGHLTAFKAKTQGTTSGQLFISENNAFLQFWHRRLLKAIFRCLFFPSVFHPCTPAGSQATVSSNVGIQQNFHNIKFISHYKGQPDIIKSTLTPKHLLIEVRHSVHVY